VQPFARPISAQWLRFNPHSNQGLIRLIKSKLGPVCFPNKPSLLGFSFPSRSLATHCARSLFTCHPKFAYKYKGIINKRSNRRQQAKEDIKVNKKKIYVKTNNKVNKNI